MTTGTARVFKLQVVLVTLLTETEHCVFPSHLSQIWLSHFASDLAEQIQPVTKI